MEQNTPAESNQTLGLRSANIPKSGCEMDDVKYDIKTINVD